MREIRVEDYDYDIHGYVLMYADSYEHPTVGYFVFDNWFFSADGFSELSLDYGGGVVSISPPCPPTKIWILPEV